MGNHFVENIWSNDCLHGHTLADKYERVLQDQVHFLVQTLFPNDALIFQEDNAPVHIAKINQGWFILITTRMKTNTFHSLPNHQI